MLNHCHEVNKLLHYGNKHSRLFNKGECFNTLDATRRLSGVRTYSPHKPTKIQFAPEIVVLTDGLYCRVNFTVRLAVTAYSLAGHLSRNVPHNDQLQRRTPFSDHQSYPTLYSNDNIVSLILAHRDVSLA